MKKTAAGKRYMAKIAGLPCVTCGNYGVQVHHIRAERIKDDFLTIPLCHDCHTGDFSIHMDKRSFENVYGNELALLAKTIESLQ